MPSGSTGAIRQGRAFVELFTDDTKLKQGLRLAENSVKKFGTSVSHIGVSMMGAGAAILAPLGLAVHEYAKAGAELKEMSERTGVAVESLSALKYAASQTGTSLEALGNGLKMSQKLLGSSLGAKTLAGFGIDAAKLKALSPEDQFLALAEAISKIPNQADRASAAMKIFGRGAISLIPLLNQGREGIASFYAAAKKKGLIWTAEDAENALRFSHGMEDIKQQVARLVQSVGASLVPVLNQFGQWLARAIPQVRQFVDEHRGWIVLAARAALYVAGIGAALWTVGKAALMVSGAFAVMRGALTVLAVLTVGITGISTAVQIATVATNAYLLSCVATGTAITGMGIATAVAQGLVALWPALLMAALAAVLYFTGGFQEMGSVFKTTWRGISDALAAGDIELSMKIMWAGIRVIWTEGVNWVLDLFTSLGTGLMKVGAFIGGGVLAGIMALTQGIHWLWTEMWTRIANGWTEAWSRLKTGIIAAKKWLHLMSDEEASAAIKTEVETRTKTIADRQQTRAQEHAEDQQRTADAVQAMENNIKALQDRNTAIMAGRAAETDKRKAELADLIAIAKAKKEAMKVNPEQYDPPPLGQPDIAGGAARADAVAGGFDVGALMSFQAGESTDHLSRIATATEKTADLLEKQDDNEGSWGG